MHQPDMLDTSILAYRELEPKLPERERAVLEWLGVYCAMQKRDPTAYELFEYMRRHGSAWDLNSVRPRLTALYKTRRLVECLQKRTCSVTGRQAYTWRKR